MKLMVIKIVLVKLELASMCADVNDECDVFDEEVLLFVNVHECEDSTELIEMEMLVLLMESMVLLSAM
jgi:hypothetical protein